MRSACRLECGCIGRQGIGSLNTIERVDPKTIAAQETTGWQTFQLHLERYQFASRFARSGLILDMACGVGYGSHLLAQRAEPHTKIIAVDLASEALAIARAEYTASNIEYHQADCMTFTWDAKFDAIVSLETFEHLDEPEKFLAHLLSLLVSRGVLVLSVPITPSVDVNPYHKHDFTRDAMLRLLEKFDLRILEEMVQIQTYNPVAMMRARERRLQDTRKNLFGYYLQMPDKAWLRLKSTIMDGFCNKYLTIAVQH